MPKYIKNNSDEIPIEFIESLAECNRKMFSRLSSDNIYIGILETSFCVLKHTRISLLFILDAEIDELRIVGMKGIDEEAVQRKNFRVGESILGDVVRDGKKRINYTSQQSSDILAENIVSSKKINTTIFLPLKVLDRVIGLLVLYLKRSEQFSRIEELMLDILANHAAVAIKNANVYKRLKFDCEDMDSVIQIARDITSTLELDQVLENILRASQQIANTDITFLWYKDLITKKWRRTFPKNLLTSGLRMPDIEKGEGIISQVLKTGCPYLCNDVTNDPYYFNSWHETKSEITIPLIIDNEVNGILDVESTKYSAFEERHLRLFSMLAGEVAIALRNAQLFEIAEQKTRQFITLRQISEALGQQKSSKEILSIIAQESLTIVGHGKKVCFVMLIDKEKKLLETKIACGDLFKEEHLRFHVPLSGQSIVTWVARNSKARVAPNVDDDSEYFKINTETRSEICIPLCFRNEVIGVIDIESSELNAFNDQDIELLQALADNTAIAIKIAELYEIRLKQLEALYNTGTKISSSLNLNQVLNAIAREALKAIGEKNRTLYVQLLGEENGSLEIKVAAGVNSEFNYVGTHVSIDNGISGWVFKNQKYYISSDVKNDPHYVEINPDVNSEMCVPIMFGGNVIGLINVESIEKNDFGEHGLQLLQGLANQAGVAIENARLSEGLANTQFQLNEAFELSLIGETLAGLNHDIRTCSSLISGEAQWIKHLHEENKLSLDESIGAMNKIEKYIERIERLTDDLSRKSQQSPLSFQKSNMADILKESVYLISSKASHYKIQTDIDYSLLQFSAEVDTRRLKRVFINIMMNAIDAMPDGGSLHIIVNRNKDCFEINFKDNGKGIPESEIPNVWDKFFTTKKEGTGLGLAICKRIVESDHSGQIRIESEKNKGTTVIVKLPIKQSEETIVNE